MKPDIVEFATDPQLLNLSLSPAQESLLRSIYGLPLTGEHVDLFHECTGRSELPVAPFAEATVIAGAPGFGLETPAARPHSTPQTPGEAFKMLPAQTVEQDYLDDFPDAQYRRNRAPLFAVLGLVAGAVGAFWWTGREAAVSSATRINVRRPCRCRFP